MLRAGKDILLTITITTRLAASATKRIYYNISFWGPDYVLTSTGNMPCLLGDEVRAVA